MNRRRVLVSVILPGLLAAAPALACVDPGGIGGTGIDGGGIGGTGQRAEAEVGVLGVVTGFASICVNGIEVHYDAATPVSLNGAPASAGALAIGQVVAVQATGSGTQARARAIDIVDAAVGPVSDVQAGGTLLQVHGQRVRVQAQTLLGGALTREQLAAAGGQTLRVSGLRAPDGAIVATRIEPAAAGTRPVSAEPADPGLARFVVQGYIGELGPGAVRVGPSTFSVAPQIASQLGRDALVRLSGRIDGGSRIVERADVLRSPFDVRPERSVRAEAAGRDSDDRRGRGGSDRGESPGRSGRDGPDNSGRSERPERVERPDRSGRR